VVTFSITPVSKSTLTSSPLNYPYLAVALLITLAFYDFVLLMFKKETRKDLQVLQGIFAEERFEPDRSGKNGRRHS
jgi:hypothetical protein